LNHYKVDYSGWNREETLLPLTNAEDAEARFTAEWPDFAGS